MPLLLAARLLTPLRCATRRCPTAEPLPQVFHHLPQFLLLLFVLLILVLRRRLSHCLVRFLDVYVQDRLMLLRVGGSLREVLGRQGLNVILRLNQEVIPACTLDLAALELVVGDFLGRAATDPTRDRKLLQTLHALVFPEHYRRAAAILLAEPLYPLELPDRILKLGMILVRKPLSQGLEG